MSAHVFTVDDVNKEILRRRLDPSQVRGLACSGCAIFGWYPFVGFFGHFGDCPKSYELRYLSFQMADGSYSHPAPRALRHLAKKSRERERPPIAIAHSDY